MTAACAAWVDATPLLARAFFAPSLHPATHATIATTEHTNTTTHHSLAPSPPQQQQHTTRSITTTTTVQMRETYGKLMYLLQDSCEEQIVELLEFK